MGLGFQQLNFGRTKHEDHNAVFVQGKLLATPQSNDRKKGRSSYPLERDAVIKTENKGVCSDQGDPYTDQPGLLLVTVWVQNCPSDMQAQKLKFTSTLTMVLMVGLMVLVKLASWSALFTRC